MTVEFIKAWNGYEAGDSDTFSATVEADLVRLGFASSMAAGNPAMLTTTPSGGVALVDSVSGENIPIGGPDRKVPYILRAASHPLASLYLNHPVYGVGNSTSIYGVYGVGTDIGKSFVYDHATGVLNKSAATISGGAGTAINGLWKSSTAVFAACLPAAATHQKIYRSADGLTGWTAVVDFSTFPNANTAGGDTPKHYAEADNGDIFIAVYNANNANNDGFNRLLLKSTDGGLTFSDISANLGDNFAKRHTHSVVWDKYRRLLWVAVGDKGDEPSLSVSDDYGVTFHTVPSSFQITGTIPAPDAIYCTSDRQSVGTPDTGIWRLPCANITDALANQFIRVYDPMKESGINYQSTNGTGFAWWGWYDDDTGCIYAAYVETTERVRVWAADAASPSYTESFACLVASSDGWNFNVIASEAATGTNTSFVRQEQPSRPNDYADWDGWHWLAGSGTRCAPWRVVPADYELSLAPTTGRVFGSGSPSKPMSKPVANQLEMTISSSDWFRSAQRYKLVENTTQPVYLPSPQMILNKKGFNSSYAGVTLLESQGFEQVGNVAPSASWAAVVSGAGALTWNSTAHPYAGAQGILANTTNTSDTATAKYTRSALAEGDWITYEGEFYVDLASMTSGSITLIKDTGGISVVLVGTSVGPYLRAVYGPLGLAVEQRSFARGRVYFPLQTQVKVTLRFRASFTSPYRGAVEVYQDGVLVCGEQGGMQTASGGGSYVLFGIATLTTLTAVNVYVDNVKIATGGVLPDQSSGIVAGCQHSLIYG